MIGLAIGICALSAVAAVVAGGGAGKGDEELDP